MAYTQIPWYNLQWFLLLKYKQQLNTHHMDTKTPPPNSTPHEHLEDFQTILYNTITVLHTQYEKLPDPLKLKSISVGVSTYHGQFRLTFKKL